MSSLFDEIAAEEAAAGARRVPTMESQDDGMPSFPKLTSVEQFKTIFMEEIRRDDVTVRMPDDDTIARMRGSGWKRPKANATGKIGTNDWAERDDGVDCHRWYLEQIAIPVEGLLQAHVIQARDMVHRLLSKSNGGFHTVLMQALNTNNGQWMPVEVGFRTTVKPFLDGFKPATFRSPTDEGIIVPLTMEDVGINKAGVVSGWMQAVNVNKEVLEIVIRWADLRNAPHARLDAKGEVIADLHVKMPTAPQGTDPALLAILAKLAEDKAPAPVVVAPESAPEAPKAEVKPKWGPKTDPTK